MSKRRNLSEPGHERWLVSYADFITLLFAFFVVLFASSQADRNKARKVAEALEKAFDGPVSSQRMAGLPKPGGIRAQPSLATALEQLTRQLEPEIRSGKMQIRLTQRGLIVSLSQATFFPSGEDALDPSSLGSLEKVAAAIRDLSNPIRAEGHTDSVPIHTGRFRSNWDLSAARAIAVMELLRDRSGISADRLAVTGYADTVPLESNQTEEGRARNRRVDIVVLSPAGSEWENEARRP